MTRNNAWTVGTEWRHHCPPGLPQGFCSTRRQELVLLKMARGFLPSDWASTSLQECEPWLPRSWTKVITLRTRWCRDELELHSLSLVTPWLCPGWEGAVPYSISKKTAGLAEAHRGGETPVTWLVQTQLWWDLLTHCLVRVSPKMMPVTPGWMEHRGSYVQLAAQTLESAHGQHQVHGC
jgi:hypothetical protein